MICRFAQIDNRSSRVVGSGLDPCGYQLVYGYRCIETGNKCNFDFPDPEACRRVYGIGPLSTRVFTDAARNGGKEQ